MDVSIKDFTVDMDLKTKGMELEIRQHSDGAHLGDMKITKTGITWYKGQTSKNGINIKWEDLITLMETK